MSTTEFMPGGETCTAVISLESEIGEAVQGPISVGYYKVEESAAIELWLECEGTRINIPIRHLKDILKQIKRAEKIALENSNG